MRNMKEEVTVMSQRNRAMADERDRLAEEQKNLRRRMAALQLLLQTKMGLDVTTLLEDIPQTAPSCIANR